MTQATPHLGLEELVRWRDEPSSGQRERIVSHLAVCDECGARFAELVRTAPPASVESGFDIDAFRARGYQALRGERSGWRAALGVRTLAPVAAALVLAVAGITYLAAPPPSERVFRGEADGVELIRPAGETVPLDELRFEWRGPTEAARYTLYVFDLASPDAPVINEDDVSSGYQPTAEERSRLQPGLRYRWFIEYREAGGGRRASPAAAFSIR